MDIFSQLCQTLNARPDRRGECYIECPECGKGGRHFSFSERGGYCFVCGFSSSLAQLAKRFELGEVTVRTVAAPKEPAKPRNWQKEPEVWVRHFCAAIDRVTVWQKYRALTLDTIQRYRLGVGILPSCACHHRRLVLPIYQDGFVIALRGRAIGCNCPKWISAAGSKVALVNVDRLHEGCTVVISENQTDAILAMQETPEVVTLASGGVGWNEKWTELLVKSRPERVILWLDNDLAGNPNEETYKKLVVEWQRDHLGAKPPTPAGPRIANELIKAGLKVSVYRWPKGTPAKADLGWAMTEGAA